MRRSAARPYKPRSERDEQQHRPSPRLSGSSLSETIIERVRRDFPGWDIYSLQAEFDDWIAADAKRQPNDYTKAFYGFVRRRHAHADV